MTCPLCSSNTPLHHTEVSGGPFGASVTLCETCLTQLTGLPDPNHWRGLAGAMWSEEPAVQVLAARMLLRLSEHDWARDLTDQLYLDDEIRAWADNVALVTNHRDSNGVPLAVGDTVILVKDLVVKGAGFTVKRGTSVRGISLMVGNDAHIEGRVAGQRIIILTEFVKKK